MADLLYILCAIWFAVGMVVAATIFIVIDMLSKP